MGTKINYIFKRVSKPLRVIEYVIAIGILWSAVVSSLIVDGGDSGAIPTSFAALVERYEIVAVVVAMMAITAVYNLVILTNATEDRRAIKGRSVATFIYTLGFFFISMLTLLSVGASNLLWVNEFTLAAVSAVLYLNLKVNYGNADR